MAQRSLGVGSSLDELSRRKLRQLLKQGAPPTREDDGEGSFMLLAFTTSMMTMVYFLRSAVSTVRQYSWNLLGRTLVIFNAVLLFEVFRDLKSAMTEATLWPEVIMALLLTSLSNALTYWVSSWQGRGRDGLPSNAVGGKTFGVMAAHLMGFSWISFWSSVQIRAREEHKNWLMVLVVPVAFLLMLLITRTLRRVRLRVILWDGVEDESERLWDEVIAEGEEEAAAMQLSFTAVQLVRYGALGLLPDDEVVSSSTSSLNLSPGAIIALYVAVGVVSFLLPVLLQFRFGEHWSRDGPVHKWMAIKAYRICLKTFTFGSGWLLTLAAQHSIQDGFIHEDDAHVLLRVAVAFAVTFTVFAVLRILGCIGVPGHLASYLAINNLFETLSLMVGFTWERCFALAISDIADDLSLLVKGCNCRSEPHTDLLTMKKGRCMDGVVMRDCDRIVWAVGSLTSLFVCCLTVPALYMHIMPLAMLNEEKLEMSREKSMDPQANADSDEIDSDAGSEDTASETTEDKPARQASSANGDERLGASRPKPDDE